MDNMRLRNYKDFLILYNKISESCFSHCVNQLAEMNLTQDESRCVDACTQKFVHVNHKVIQVYMDIQPEIINRRVEEMTRVTEAAAKESSNAEQEASNPKELVGNSAAG